MNQFCQSCGMPLNSEGAKSASGSYCQYCTDESGKLHPREAVQQGIAQWLKSFAPENGQADFDKRAAHYMKAMPAWAEE